MGPDKSAQPDCAAARRPRVEEILLVEDDMELIRDLLGSWRPPFPITAVSSGKAAFDYLQRFEPVLVILDLSLPHYLTEVDTLEGFGILSYIRVRIGTHLPVIVISRDAAPVTKAHVHELGANDFLDKPLNLRQLDRVVQRIIGRSDQGR